MQTLLTRSSRTLFDENVDDISGLWCFVFFALFALSVHLHYASCIISLIFYGTLYIFYYLIFMCVVCVLKSTKESTILVELR